MMRIPAGRWLIVVLLGLVATGCAQTRTFQASGDFERPQGRVRVLLMPPDIELYEIAASGMAEPRADWTATAERNVRAALERHLAARDAELVEYESPGAGVALIHPEHVQLVKLHQAVGRTILTHKYVQELALPTKQGALDWTLGQNAAALRRAYDADYALFVNFRDSFTSTGRAAVIVVAAVLGYAVQGGHQEGFASLVHLRSGEIVWFNVLSSSGGDLRDPAMAAGATSQLLSELPL
ncbi:MAG: hypothetical protein GWN84_18725 [Gammaproteobacteria bacterium]|nr:hypothetical protein [Gammaproteobacteria bacterium]NIR84860.1 hypothetical protein [Gammaproteobacteria bacterium]NIR91685.1 hypothetical protein [Gammaproteobacteria bacterium]NIU05907.1 hypothetical protein [Gammaproteobacteria bacterium]NIV52954.1 hypothetical protein [Gammaproteobacteria bacterium]